MSRVISSQANATAPTPPTEDQQVTLEISNRLPSHLLYKYSMCTKDNLTRAAGREEEVCLTFEHHELERWPTKVTQRKARSKLRVGL